jgi:hypothetical protein
MGLAENKIPERTQRINLNVPVLHGPQQRESNYFVRKFYCVSLALLKWYIMPHNKIAQLSGNPYVLRVKGSPCEHDGHQTAGMPLEREAKRAEHSVEKLIGEPHRR